MESRTERCEENKVGCRQITQIARVWQMEGSTVNNVGMLTIVTIEQNAPDEENTLSTYDRTIGVIFENPINKLLFFSYKHSTLSEQIQSHLQTAFASTSGRKVAIEYKISGTVAAITFRNDVNVISPQSIAYITQKDNFREPAQQISLEIPCASTSQVLILFIYMNFISK